MTSCARCGYAWGDGSILFCGWQGGRAVYSNETCGSFSPAKQGQERPLTPFKNVSVQPEALKFTMGPQDGFLIEDSIRHIKTYEGPLDVVVDLGAHVGTFALYAASRGAKVYAVEASITNYDNLLKNIENNKELLAGSVIPMRKAVTNKTGETLKLKHAFQRVEGGNDFLVGNTGQKSLIYNDKYPVECSVETISLLDLLRDVAKESGKIDYLKCDIEGSEFDFLSIKDKALPKYLKGIGMIEMSVHPLDAEKYFDAKEGDWLKKMQDWFDSMGVFRNRLIVQ